MDYRRHDSIIYFQRESDGAIVAFLTDYQIAKDSNFLAKVQMALVSTSLAVQAEAANVANHAARSSFALRVIADPAGFAVMMAPGFTVNGAADLSATDANLESRASANFNAYCVQG